MPFFKDTSGREWKVNFDGVLLKQLRDDEKINLSDVSGASYIILNNDPAALVRALGVLCADEIKERGLDLRQFAKAITAEAIDAAWDAIWEAAGLFFPARLLSALRSNFATQKVILACWQNLQPVMAILNQPEFPEGMRQEALESLGTIMHTVSTSDLRKLVENSSVLGPAEIQSTPATDSPGIAA